MTTPIEGNTEIIQSHKTRGRDKGRLGPFVPLLKETLESAAWRAMSPSARVLY
jgi:hypothetical protein